MWSKTGVIFVLALVFVGIDSQAYQKNLSLRPPSISGCIKTVCGFLAAGKCNDESEIEKVTELCDGVYDNRCVTTICTQLGPAECNDFYELKDIVAQCR